MKSTLSKIDINSRTIVLSAILLMGLLFRLYDLGGESLWLDEAMSVKYANLNLFQISFLHSSSPPLYYILLHWWISLFGTSEFALRFPSVIYGIVSILMIYKIGGRLFDVSMGKISALLMTFSVFHIQYSQEARTYSLSVLLTLLSMYFFIKVLKDMRHRILFGYILSSILLMYSHQYSLFVIIAQNIYLIFLSLFFKKTLKLDVKKWLLIQFLLVLLFMPWGILFLHHVTHFRKGFWIETPHISAIIFSFKTYSSGSTLLLWLFLVLSIFSFLSFEKLRDTMDRKMFFRFFESYVRKVRLLNPEKIYFLLIWLITPIIFPFIISRVFQPIYITRYTILASPAFFLLVSKGISNLPGRIMKSIIITIVIAVSLMHIREYYTEIKKEHWREVAEYIDKNAHNRDMVLFNAYYCMQPFNYYSRSDIIVKKGFPVKYREVEEKDINGLLETIKHHDRIWLVLSHSGDQKELITKTLVKSYKISDQKEYKRIKFYLFEKGY